MYIIRYINVIMVVYRVTACIENIPHISFGTKYTKSLSCMNSTFSHSIYLLTNSNNNDFHYIHK